MSTKDLTWVEISKSALARNANAVKKCIGRSLLFSVVKSNAYGHGMKEVVTLLDDQKAVDGYMVVSLDEALSLSQWTRKRIIVLSMWQKDPSKLREALQRSIELPVFDEDSASYLSRIAYRCKRRAKVHIKIDVGTSRLGFHYDDSESVMRLFRARGFAIVGLFSHFADSENKNEAFTVVQEERFSKMLDIVRTRGTAKVSAHIACSAAALRHKAYVHDIVRLGIALYGLWPSEDTRHFSRVSHFEPVLSWKTRILQVKKVPAGTAIGYGMTYRCLRPAVIATVPVGYWDGYDRRFSNRGKVLIGGSSCPVRGRICMNLMMVEVRPGVSVKPYDEVVLLGRSGMKCITADDLAAMSHTINYEIVTRINPLLPRRAVK